MVHATARSPARPMYKATTPPVPMNWANSTQGAYQQTAAHYCQRVHDELGVVQVVIDPGGGIIDGPGGPAYLYIAGRPSIDADLVVISRLDLTGVSAISSGFILQEVPIYPIMTCFVVDADVSSGTAFITPWLME